MKEVQEFTVGENTFYITPFPALEAVRISGELANMLAPLLSAILPLAKGLGDKGFSVLDVDMGDVARAMNGLHFSGEDLEKMVKNLLLKKNIGVEYEDEDGETESAFLDKELLNDIFCGNIDELFMLCWHVINVNYGGFFTMLGAPFGSSGDASDILT